MLLKKNPPQVFPLLCTTLTSSEQCLWGEKKSQIQKQESSGTSTVLFLEECKQKLVNWNIQAGPRSILNYFLNPVFKFIIVYKPKCSITVFWDELGYQASPESSKEVPFNNPVHREVSEILKEITKSPRPYQVIIRNWIPLMQPFRIAWAEWYIASHTFLLSLSTYGNPKHQKKREGRKL